MFGGIQDVMRAQANAVGFSVSFDENNQRYEFAHPTKSIGFVIGQDVAQDLSQMGLLEDTLNRILKAIASGEYG